MRKSILRLGALALMSLMSISVWAETYRTPEGSYYDLDKTNLTATLTLASVGDDWSGDWKSLKIGDVSYTVTKVFDKAFANVSGGEHKVTIPSTLQVIGMEAFKGVTITALGDARPTFTFPAYLQLGEGAFENATFPANTTIDLGNRPSLPGKIFNGSDNITYVLCTGLEEIPDYAFADCEELLYIGSVTDGKYYLPKDLSEVGMHAFDGCKNLSYIKFKDITSRIKVVGDYAFKNCKKFDDSIIKNVCGKFDADLTYGKGSFYGCSLETVDLEASTVKVTAAETNPNYSDASGVPEYAFYGNKIKSLKLPTCCVAIEASAFASNYKSGETENTFVATLDIPTLPSTLMYIEANAFDNSLKSEADGSLSAKEQNSLSLPQSLKSIGADAFQNRTITTIYASAGANKDNVPELKAQTDLTVSNTVIPSVVWKDGNLKSSFEGKGWKGSEESPAFDYNVRYAKVNDNTINTVICEYVEYTITQGTDGVYTATPTKYNTNSPTIYGQFDKAAANVKSEGDDIYPLTFKVAAPDNAITTLLTSADFKLTFSPKVGMQGTDSNVLDAASYNTISSKYVGNFATQIKDVNIGEGITVVADNAFQSCVNLESVTLPNTLATVGASAFQGTSITEISLPKSLQSLGKLSFNTATLKTVTVDYDKDGEYSIPKINATNNERTFHGNNTTKLVVTGTAPREAYLAKKSNDTAPVYYWVQFFNTDYTVNVTKTGNNAPTTRIATIDEGDKRIYVLNDANDVKEVEITSQSPAEIPAVRYIRTFTSTNYQCWYVPFDFIYEDNSEYTFYYINNSTTKEDFTADAAPYIELKEVKIAEGETKIKANTPYIIKPKEAKAITFDAAEIQNTKTESFTVTSALNTFKFTGTYNQKLSTGSDDWYGVTGGNFTKFEENKGIQAYRFYMEMGENQSGPYYNAPEVKFVVLDDEDATGIKNVNAESLAAPMFDLMGRQIAAPAKGQVYIQNGVKKLAK